METGRRLRRTMSQQVQPMDRDNWSSGRQTPDKRCLDRLPPLGVEGSTANTVAASIRRESRLACSHRIRWRLALRFESRLEAHNQRKPDYGRRSSARIRMPSPRTVMPWRHAARRAVCLPADCSTANRFD